MWRPSQHLDCSLSLSHSFWVKDPLTWLRSFGVSILLRFSLYIFNIYTTLITMVRFISSLLLGSLCATAAWANEDPPSCSTSEQCPEDKPCCSREYSKSIQWGVQQDTNDLQNMDNAVLALSVWEDVTLSHPSPSTPVSPNPSAKTRPTRGTTLTTRP